MLMFAADSALRMRRTFSAVSSGDALICWCMAQHLPQYAWIRVAWRYAPPDRACYAAGRPEGSPPRAGRWRAACPTRGLACAVDGLLDEPLELGRPILPGVVDHAQHTERDERLAIAATRQDEDAVDRLALLFERVHRDLELAGRVRHRDFFDRPRDRRREADSSQRIQ